MGLLRLSLAFAVVLTHLNLSHRFMISGGDAVKVFFVISGFYMAMILTTKYQATADGLKKFATNRFLRLYPPYIFILLLTVIWHVVCEFATGGGTPSPMLLKLTHELPTWQAAIAWIVNLGLVGTDLPSLFHWTPSTGLEFLSEKPHDNHGNHYWLGFSVWVRQAWSVGAEIWFYLTAPLLASLSPKRFAKIWIGLVLFTVVFQFYFPRSAYFFWPALLSFFATGMLAFFAYKQFDIPKVTCSFSKWIKALVYLLPLGWVLFLPLLGMRLLPLFVYLLTALWTPFLFSVSKNSRIDRFLGDLSYGVYLNHLLVISVVTIGLKRFSISEQLLIPLVLVGTTLAAMFVLWWIERPIDRIRQRIAAAAK